MCSRCAERRAALIQGARALLRADARTAAQSARDIGRSLAADARRLADRTGRRP